jgi:hypothetical protein
MVRVRRELYVPGGVPVGISIENIGISEKEPIPSPRAARASTWEEVDKGVEERFMLDGLLFPATE